MLANLTLPFLPYFLLLSLCLSLSLSHSLSPTQVSRWTSRWSWRTRGRSSSGAAPSRGCKSLTSSSRSPRLRSWSPRPTIAPGWATWRRLAPWQQMEMLLLRQQFESMCRFQLHAPMEDIENWENSKGIGTFKVIVRDSAKLILNNFLSTRLDV